MAAKKGKFKPINPKKYKGNPTNIIYRSGLELKVMIRFDTDPQILEWSSEEIIIPYRCKTDNKMHRYFPDFLVKIKQSDGKIKTFLVEVKPYAQTLPPVKGNKKQKTFITEVMTYAKNHSKWEMAEEYCKNRGWKFIFLTEKEINSYKKDK